MRIIFGICLLVILSRTTEAAQCACATDALNVRTGYSLKSLVYASMTNGQCAPFNGDRHTADGHTWAHITFNGRSGYAATEWLVFKSCGGGSTLSGCPTIITRSQWGARAPTFNSGNMPGTPKYVFVHHGASAPCFTEADCKAKVRSYQAYHMDTHHWPDIGYSFVIGEDGHVYEGRGWKEIGAHTLNYNNVGIGICIIGNFMEKVPNQAALNALKQLIQCGVDNHRISSSYVLRGHKDMPGNPTACPGTKLETLSRPGHTFNVLKESGLWTSKDIKHFLRSSGN